MVLFAQRQSFGDQNCKNGRRRIKVVFLSGSSTIKTLPSWEKYGQLYMSLIKCMFANLWNTRSNKVKADRSIAWKKDILPVNSWSVTELGETPSHVSIKHVKDFLGVSQGCFDGNLRCLFLYTTFCNQIAEEAKVVYAGDQKLHLKLPLKWYKKLPM